MKKDIAAILISTAIAAGCGGDAEPVIDPGDAGDYLVSIDPADFVSEVDNPWFPLPEGARWVYEGRDGDETESIEVVVTGESRTVMGITVTVVRDTVTIDGELAEHTFDWFAQDSAGNVWYLGEESTEYEDGEAVSTAGSWEAGVDGALPGVIMWADPQIGDAYRQEFYEGEAEDVAEVVRQGDTVSVPFGDFDSALVIREWNRLEPDIVEEKYYVAGIGPVLEVETRGGSGKVELVSFDLPG